MGTEPTEKERPAEEAEEAEPVEAPAPFRSMALPIAPAGVRAAVIAKHLALALAVCASTALVIDYQHVGEPAFCGVESACFQVRLSPYSHLFGIPLPNLALPAFAVLMGGSIFASNALHHRILAAIAGVGAVAAAALIAIQAVSIGAFCKWCVIVDSSALIAGFASIGLAVWIKGDEKRAALASVQGRSATAWSIAGAAAIGLPFLWARYPDLPPPPPEIAAQLQPGKVTIISYTDFECPFCRQLHPTMDALREKYKDKIRFVRKMKPLAGHAGAMPAAKAWVCAPETKRDDVAAALYEMEPGDLKLEKLVDLADKFGLGSREAFSVCMQSKVTEAAVERDASEFVHIHGRGLPYTFVNGRTIVGRNPDGLTRAVEMELGGPGTELPVSAMFAILALLVVGASAITWRARPEPAAA